MITYGSLDEITYDAEVDGELVRKTLGVRVFDERGWSTVMIVFQERTKDLSAWRAPKVAVLRMRKVGEGWKKQSSVTLPAAHALALGVDITQRFADLLKPGELDDDEPSRFPE
jgi:hypothetical protein